MRPRAAVLVASALAACGGEPVASHALEEAPLTLDAPAVVALAPERARPVVEVALDGREPRSFLVDCGAGISGVHARCAEELGLAVWPYSDGFDLIGAGGARSRVGHYALLETLRIGALRVEAARLPVIDDDALLEAGVDGILGQDLLARLVVAIDMRRGELHLVPYDGPQAAREHLERAGLGAGSWLKLELLFTPQPVLPLEHEGAGELELWFDTGAVRSSLPAGLFAALGNAPAGTTERGGIGGRFDEETHVVRAFRFFGFEFAGEVSASTTERGLLGMDVLGQLVVVLEGPARTVWLHRR